MTIPPVIERELRCGLRKGDARKLRMQVAIASAAFTICHLFIMPASNVTQFGQYLYNFQFVTGLYIALVQTPVIAAGMISRERHSQTLGLLFLAGMRPMELFAAKVISGAVLSFGNLLAIAPFMAVPFLSGGLSAQVFIATVVFLPNLLFFALSLSIFGSTVCLEEGAALVITTLLGGIIICFTPALYQANSLFAESPSLSAAWLLASPGYGPYLVFSNFATGSISEFWLNSAVTLAWSILALGIAAWTLRRTWQDKPAGSNTTGWLASASAWFHGTSQWRRKLSLRWLDSHPFAWLAMQNRMPERIAWAAVAVITAAWLVAWGLWPKHWLSIPNFLFTAFILNSVVEFIVLYAAGKRIGEDRQRGALELLLTSPIDIDEIVEDQMLALRHQFQPVYWAILGLNLTLMTGGFALRNWPGVSALNYLIVWSPLLAWSWRRTFRCCLVATWASLNCGRPAYVVWRILGNFNIIAVLAPIYILLPHLARKLNSYPTGSWDEFVFIGAVFIFFLVYMQGQRNNAYKMLDTLRQEFRSIAETPVPEPSDSRLKHWQIYERLDGKTVWRDFVLGPRWKG